MDPAPLNRREFVVGTTALCTAAAAGELSAAPAPVPVFQATGARAGEVTDRTAIVWARNTSGQVRAGKPEAGEQDQPLDGACPGTPGRIRVHYSLNQNLNNPITSDWIEVSAKTDFIHQFALTGLEPGSQYYYATETG